MTYSSITMLVIIKCFLRIRWWVCEFGLHMAEHLGQYFFSAPAIKYIADWFKGVFLFFAALSFTKGAVFLFICVCWHPAAPTQHHQHHHQHYQCPSPLYVTVPSHIQSPRPFRALWLHSWNGERWDIWYHWSSEWGGGGGGGGGPGRNWVSFGERWLHTPRVAQSGWDTGPFRHNRRQEGDMCRGYILPHAGGLLSCQCTDGSYAVSIKLTRGFFILLNQ